MQNGGILARISAGEIPRGQPKESLKHQFYTLTFSLPGIKLKHLVVLRGVIMTDEDYICIHCGTKGLPVLVPRGHVYVEVFLWLCLVVPGVVYTLWRRLRKQEVCPECLYPEMISVYSPKARQMMALANIAPGVKKPAKPAAKTSSKPVGKPRVKPRPISGSGLKKPRPANPTLRKK